MSQRDLAAELRASRITAPNEVRERVRLVALAATPPPRRITWRRALVVALPVAAAIAASIVFTRPDHQQRVVHGVVATTRETALDRAALPATTHGSTLQAQTGSAGAKAFAPAPPRGRAVDYDATLALRVPNAAEVSSAVKRALRIASSLGGYPTSVHAQTHAKSGTADLTLKIPRAHVQEAVTRLSALGTITAEQVDLQDLQAGINATNREIARLQKQLAALRAQPPTPATERKIAALTARIASLQRGTADTRRTAHYATVSLHVATPTAAVHKTHHGPLHGLRVALRWIGIGAVYALALGLPALLVVALGWLAVRAVRRRREAELLSRP
jgi:Domain of unknown function (DUF4349)